MTNQVEKFDPAQLMQGVRDRVKATFVSLIPDDQWEMMVKKEIEFFFEERRRDNSYVHYSDFRKVCSEVMNTVAREKVVKYLEEYDSQIWNCESQTYKPSDLLKKLIIDSAPEIFASAFGGMFQNVISNMKRNY